MVGAEFIANAFLGLPLSIAYLIVGGKLHRRSYVESRPPLAWFAAFWVGIGAYGLAESAWSLAYLARVDALPVGLLVLHVKIVGSVIAFAGLVTYLLTIHAADRRIVSVTVGAYGVILALTETYYSWRAPIAQVPGVWGMRLLYSVNETHPWWTLVLVMLLLPPLLATFAYARLLRHAKEPETRYRIALTSASLALFFLPMFAGWRAGGAPWWGGVERTLSLLMLVGIALATWPPPALVRRWARRPVDEHQLELELQERARHLV